MNPIKQGLRDVLVAVHNGHSSADAIASKLVVARSTVIERLRQLREASMVSNFNNIYQSTAKGMEVILHAPVLQKGQQITAYGHAHATKVPVPKYEVYHCPELGRNPGLTDDRFTAFELPSRRGNNLYHPDGRVTPA
jgi:hypothetical protein